MSDATDRAMKDGMQTLAAGYLCTDCKWCGSEPQRETVRGDPASGEAYWVVIESCPDCSSEDLEQVTLCLLCKVDGIDTPATCDDHCRSCAERTFEPEDLEIFKRDQVQPVKPLVQP